MDVHGTNLTRTPFTVGPPNNGMDLQLAHGAPLGRTGKYRTDLLTPRVLGIAPG